MAATNINRVVMTGNLTADPELRSLPSGTSVCSLRIACNTRRKNGSTGEWEDKPNYFNVTVWGAQGENAARYLSKGRPVAIDGRLEWREWEAQDGTKRQATDIIADSVQFLGSRDDASGGGGRSRIGVAAREPHRAATSRRRRGLPARTCRRSAPATTTFRSESAPPTSTDISEASFEWQSTRSRQAGAPARQEGRARQRPAQAMPALPRQGRAGRLQGRRHRCASSSPRRARSARGGSPAPAGATRSRSPAPSSARASWRCCRT